MSAGLLARLILLPLLLLVFDDVHATDATGTVETRTDTPSKASQNKSKSKPVPKRLVQISGKTKLNVRDWPLIGSPDAKYVFVEMFDYTCPHCRSLQYGIDQAFKRYGKELAIVTLPVPMAADCNSSVGSTPAHHRDACEIAQLSVAVWRLKPSRFAEFHRWLFESESPRTAREARKRAATIVGEDGLQKELAKKTPAKFIASHVKLYQKAGGGSVPKLMFPRVTLVGDVGAETLCATIERELRVR